jgi:hypothetical protein
MSRSLTQVVERRTYLQNLLERLRDGAVRPREAFAEARAVWLSGQWPSQHEEGFDPVANDVLFFLADARRMGVSHQDASAMLAYVQAGEPDAEAARERYYDYLLSIDMTAREALQQSDDYYGPPSHDVDDEEIAFSDPEARRLHRGVRLDPESVWEDVRKKLCQARPRDEGFLNDLVEALMFRHADEYIDRIERVVEECTGARAVVAYAHVGGIAPTPALERFWRLQERLAPDDAAW